MKTFIYNEEQTWKDRYLSSKGRLNRKPFIMRNIFVTALAVALRFGLTNMAAGTEMDVTADVMLLMALVGALVLMVLALAVDAFLMIRRLHDMNLTGWLVLVPYVVSIVPYTGQALSLAISLYLCIAKGTAGDNQYGPDPLLRKPYNVI